MKHAGRTAACLALMLMLPGQAAQAEEDCTGAAAKPCRDGVIAQIKASRYSTKTAGFLPQGFAIRSGVILASTLPLQKNLAACRTIMREKGGKLLTQPNIFGFCVELAAGGKIGRIIEVE